MNLKEYFDNTDGMGVLSTADGDGNVNSAIYASPHFIDDETVAFIMRPRLSYHNIQANPKAAYLYVEKGPGYTGKRLSLEKTDEESNPETISQVRRKGHGSSDDEGQAVLVYFKIIGIRPLVGNIGPA